MRMAVAGNKRRSPAGTRAAPDPQDGAPVGKRTSRIVLATASADLQERVEQAADGTCLTLALGALPDSPAAFFTQLGLESPPAVVVLDCGDDATSALDLAAQFNVQCPGISVVLVSDLGFEVGLEAMRAGVRDIVDPDSSVSTIQVVLSRAADAARARGSESRAVDGAAMSQAGSSGRVISVVSPKGGVGKTTVATNLAVGLAQTGRHSTVLVDLDLQFGDVATALNVEPEFALPDTLHGPASRDTMVLKTFLTLHDSGLYVICGARSPVEADTITAEQVSRLLQMLASEFQYVVVDTAPGLSEHVLASMDASSDLVLVTSMDVAGLRGLRKELEALTELGMVTDSRCVVLNLVDLSDGLSEADARETIGTAVDVMLPRSRAVPRSVNQGVPLMQSGTRDPMTKGLRGLVARYAPAPGHPAEPAAPARVAITRAPVAEVEPDVRPRRAAASRWSRIRRTAV